MLRLQILTSATILVLAGCAAHVSTQAPSTASREIMERSDGPAYSFVTRAASCWLGGLWSDAVGEKDDARFAGIRRRCDDVLTSVGESPEGAYYPLRAVDPKTVDKLARHVSILAYGNKGERANSASLVSLLVRTANASRETMHARRAADKVKEDASAAVVAVDYRQDKLAASPEVAATDHLRLIVHGDAGPYRAEGETIGLLMAIDRVEIARGLPKHLKIYALRGAYQDLFGVTAPELSAATDEAIPRGTWLRYLSQVAAAAGHPVPPNESDVLNRETLAYDGVLEGLADRLRRLDSELPSGSTLEIVERAVVSRLDTQYKTELAWLEASKP
jgi:hypothetical protein